MDNSRKALQGTVKMLQNYGKRRGMNITIEEMAGQINMPAQQLQACLNGEEETPAGVSIQLQAAYGITSTMISITEAVNEPEPPPPGEWKDLPDNAFSDEQWRTYQLENNKELLQHTVVFLRNRGLAEGINISLEDMARAIGIPVKQLLICLKEGYNTVTIGNLSNRLRSAYKELLKDVKEIEVKEDINMIMASGKDSLP